MARKRWTPQEEVTDSLLRFREKRKWQLAYRRYVMEGTPSEMYAPYFGLDAQSLRKWFEIQFTDDLNWANFGTNWQFDHIVPAAYFDYSNEEDLKLCWSFINIRVERIEQNKNRGNKVDVISVRPYFQELYNKTSFSLCLKMLEKIETLEISNIGNNASIERFIIDNKEWLEQIADLSPEEFGRYNAGMKLSDILLEREILKKFS